MCGILILKNQAPFNHRMLASLRRRGPDEIGFWSDGGFHIGHTRLSIIGLDERGTQPMENATHVLAFNGEIYNFLQLKQRLGAAGVLVSGTSDSEVLLHAWSLWGPDILRDLEGFWAFAILDKRTRKLSLVRDQFGVKPLYYYMDGDRFCAASLIRTIADLVGPGLSLDHEAMSEYVRYQFTFGDKTFFQKVRKVVPGHIVEVDLNTGTAATRQYEDILKQGAELERVNDDWVTRTRTLLEAAIVESTISDASFTTFCSGGVDSSLITRLAKPEIAYHCNFSDPECNETFYARQVVDGTPIRLFVVNADEEFDLVQRLRDIVEDFDELTIGSVILPLENLLAQVKRRYKVILTGTGGDELFAGYVRFQLVTGQCFQDSYKALFGRMRGVDGVSARFELTHRKGDPRFYQFYEPRVERSFHDAFEACRVEEGDELAAMLCFDRRYFLQGLLNIDDKMCGRHSLESRPSYLHQRLVRHLMRVDPRDLLQGEDLKPVLRRIADGVLPESVLRRSDKMGFTTPIGTFVNRSAHLIREQITSSPFRDLYDLRRMNLNAETKFSRETFGLLMLDLWLNRYARA